MRSMLWGGAFQWFYIEPGPVISSNLFRRCKTEFKTALQTQIRTPGPVFKVRNTAEKGPFNVFVREGAWPA